MDQRSPGRPYAVDWELLERPSDAGSDVAPVLLRPVAHLRSPIVEHRSTEPLPPDSDRPSLVILPVRELIAPLAWAVLPAIPVLALLGWQAALIVGAAAALIRELDSRVGRATFSFGDGFLPFRPLNAWPQGVQEEDDVRWNWSPAYHQHGARG